MIWERGKKVSSMLIGGKYVSMMWYNGHLIWGKLTYDSAWFRSEGYFQSEPW